MWTEYRIMGELVLSSVSCILTHTIFAGMIPACIIFQLLAVKTKCSANWLIKKQNGFIGWL